MRSLRFRSHPAELVRKRSASGVIGLDVAIWAASPTHRTLHSRLPNTGVLAAAARLLWGIWLGVAVLPPDPAQVQNATWLPNPGSGEWTTGTNWTGGTIPTGTAT